jgi:hypothetical protein
VEQDTNDGWISLEEASVKAGLSEKTLRKRIKDGTLPYRQVETRWGLAYQLRLEEVPGSSSRVEGESSSLEGRVEAESSTLEDQLPQDDAGLVQALQRALEMISKLQEEATAKGEAASLWQGRAEMLSYQLNQSQDTIKALEAPKVEEHDLEQAKPWWRFWAS